METFNGVNVDLRSEVGLLSHNVKVEGATDSDLFGGQIFVHQCDNCGKVSVHMEFVEV